MKLFLIITILISYSINAMAKSQDEKEAEKNAKAICLMKDPLIRGQKLNECIKKELEGTKKSN